MKIEAKAKGLSDDQWIQGAPIELDNGRVFMFESMKQGMFGKFEANKKINTNHVVGHRVLKNEVDPKTVCQKLRGSDLFEGDKVRAGAFVGHVFYSEESSRYLVRAQGLTMTLTELKWKPIGKNIHD